MSLDLNTASHRAGRKLCHGVTKQGGYLVGEVSQDGIFIAGAGTCDIYVSIRQGAAEVSLVTVECVFVQSSVCSSHLS